MLKELKEIRAYNSLNYDNWYVLFVKTGREEHIKSIIEKYAESQIPILIFYRELIMRRAQRNFNVKNILFGGYIFVYEKIDECMMVAKKYLANEFIRPVAINNKPCKVNKLEMKFLLQCSDRNGVFKLSKAYKENDKIKIIDGSLKNLNGNILWVDEKKQKAKVQILLFNKKLEVSLGFELLENVYQPA